MKKLVIGIFLSVCLLGANGLLTAQTCSGGSCGAPVSGAEDSSFPVLTSKAYASMKKSDVFVVMFTAAYCGFCRNAKKELLPSLAQQLAANENVHLFLMDVEKDVVSSNQTPLKTAWGVQKLPTFVVVYNDAVVYSKTGYSSRGKQTLEKEILAAVSHYK